MRVTDDSTRLFLEAAARFFDDSAVDLATLQDLYRDLECISRGDRDE